MEKISHIIYMKYNIYNNSINQFYKLFTSIILKYKSAQSISDKKSISN